MNIRPKTMRRLLILLSALACFLAVLVGFYLASVVRNNRSLKQKRMEAMSAFRAGDYARSVDLLAAYREKLRRPDPEAEFAYGVSRVRVELPQGRQIQEGIHIFSDYLQNIKPGDSAAQRELLRLYVMRGYNAEALHLADELLAKNGKDAEVLQDKVDALAGDHKTEQALAVSQTLNEADPLNLRGQMVTLALLAQLNAPADKIVARAEELLRNHPKDPRFEMLLAFAYSQTRQDELARQWLKTAASRTPPDSQFVQSLIAQLYASELFADADAFLARSVGAIKDVAIERMWAQRLWQQGKIAELLQLAGKLHPADPASDGSILGYLALAQFAGGKTDEGHRLIEAMARQHDSASQSWATALNARYATPPLRVTDLATQLQAAAAQNPENPVVREMLAEAYLRMNETELVIQQSTAAIKRAPAWATPLLLMAQAYSASGRQYEALSCATDAMKRAPERYDVIVQYVESSFAWISESGIDADYQRLLVDLQQLQTEYHDAETLPIYVAVLARTGRRGDAISAIRRALESAPPLPLAVLTRLAEVADSEKLEVGAAIRDFAAKTQGSSPDMALARARTLLEDGHPQRGLQLLRDAAKGHENDISWRIAVALYCEASQEGEPLKDWIALGDQYPADLQLQEAILHCQSRLADRAFWARTIERVKALTGEQGILWRVERSRWLLAGDLDERDKAEAVNLLTQVTAAAPSLPEPHRLLGLAMEKVDNIPGAIAELTAAADARTADPTITRELVRLLLANNRPEDAIAYLDKLAQTRNLPADVVHWLARTYSDLHYNEKALAVLSAEEAGTDHLQRDCMMAGLYRRMGRTGDASALYKSLLAQPIYDPSFWAEGADFFASQEDMPSAEQFLARMARLPLNPGVMELIRARFDERWVGQEEARQMFEAAVKADPHSASAWGELAGFYLRRQRFADARAAVAKGLAAVPPNKPLQALAADCTTLAEIGVDRELQSLVVALSENPADPGAVQTLSVIAQGRRSKWPAAEMAQKISEVAERFPLEMFLQEQAIRSFTTAGLPEEAASFARRSAEANPRSADPQRLLSVIYFDAGDWTRAEQAALLWRQRAPDQAKSANLSLAEIYLQQAKKFPSGAISVLSPYLPAKGLPTDPRVTELYARALIISDRSNEASDLLRPLLADSRRWRATWLNLAPANKNAHDAAQWIGVVAPLIPVADAGEQCALAEAWYRVGVQFDDATAFQKATTLLKPLLQTPTDLPQAWLLEALAAQAQSDYTNAEKAYRHILQRNPEAPEGRNNLAYLLWLKGRKEDLPEAETLVRLALTAKPTEPSFYDTLARIQARRGNIRGARESFRAALEHNPTSIEALIGQADLLARDPKTRDEARTTLLQLNRLLESNPPLSSTLRKEYTEASAILSNS